MNDILNNRYGVFGLLGSFWPEKLDNKSTRAARSIADLAKRTTIVDSLTEAARNLAGERQALVSGITLTFDSKALAVMGPDHQARIAVTFSDNSIAYSFIRRPGLAEYVFPQTGFINYMSEDTGAVVVLQTETDCEYALMPETNTSVAATATQADWLTRYLIPIPFGLIPVRIRNAAGVDLLTGLDFEVGEGVLVVRQPPHELFPDNYICIESGFKRLAHLLNYTLAVRDINGPIEPLVRYARDQQSAPAFLRALACACNFVVMPWTATVLAHLEKCGKHYYEFEYGVIEVDYAHEELTIGDEVIQGDILGDVLGIKFAQFGGDQAWWRSLSWSAGLSLDALCPISGIVIPDTPCLATAVSEDAGGIHIRINFGGDQALEDKFWTHQQRAELLSGNYLNQLVGLAAVGDTTNLNPLNLYFDYLLSARAWIVTRKLLPFWDNERVARFNAFITREKPFGGVVLVKDL